MRLRAPCALLALLVLAALDSSECLQTVIRPDKGSAVTVSTVLPLAQCAVCTVGGPNDTQVSCHTSLTLVPEEEVKLLFNCSQPVEQSYTVTITRSIECTQSSCTPAAAEVDPNLFKDFKRSLTWDISVPERTVLTLDFPGGGLKDVSAAEKCQDGFQYSVSTPKSDGEINTKSYCKGGAVSHLDLLGGTTVTVEVPEGELDQAVFNVSAAPRGGRMMVVTPDPDTIITITRVPGEAYCSVCEGKPPNQKCHPRSLTLSTPQNTSVEFTCPRPQDVFIVQINREIDCRDTTCSDYAVQAESSLFPDFNRSFTWDLTVVSTRAFQLDFPEPGMLQIPNEETCPDEHTYYVVVYVRTGPATIGTFCKGGTVTTVMGVYKGRLILQVPGDTKLNPVGVKLNVGPETNMLAIVKVNLPRGVSGTEFTTANYPKDFPDIQHMQWDFTVPGMHNYTVDFRDYMLPECLKDEVAVEYQKEDKKVTKLTLTDNQPTHQQGNFKMVLKNCETNRTLQGLALTYRVSVMRSGHPVLCTVDLTKHPGVSLHIEKLGSDPYCEISVDSDVKEKINVAAGTTARLSFLDCPDEAVRLTASEAIVCQSKASCSSSILTVPALDSCLPFPLHSFTWHINIPQDCTVDLVSPTGSLRQSLPGQKCNHPVSLHVAERDGFSIGDFCYNGTIQKVQVHANMSVTATVKDFNKTRGPFLNVSVSQEISETIIYRVSPKMSSPTLLATPNWPEGMKPFSTVSWIVTVPSQYKADLHFVNVTQPKCDDRHTAMKVQMLGYAEEIMSRREDEQVEKKLLLPQSFYLNMSNCIPQEGRFGALTKIVLQKKSNLLAILLGIAGALLLALIVLAVVCLVTKKKKQRMNKESSIYIGKGNIFRPGDMHFSKARSDNESHVYDSIDESMVYGHLLGDSSYADSMQDHFKGPQVDSYHTFTGPTDQGLPVIKEPDQEPEMDQYNTFLAPSDSFIPPRPRTPVRQDSLGFQDRRMVDNELYTFKSTGEINTIRLSGADLEPEPAVFEDSL